MTLRDLIRCAAMVGLAGIFSANAAGPYAFTQPHWAVTSTLNGMAGPNGLPSTAWFEWGETAAYGQTTAAVEVGASTGVVRVSAAVSNLVQGPVYHARLVVSNALGIAYGQDEPLITPGRMKVALLGSGYCATFPLPIVLRTCIPCAPPPPPFEPPGVTDVVGISSGSLVLRSDGVAFRGGMVLSNVVAIAGAYPDLGLQADGTVVASDGNVPSNLHDVVAITRGGLCNMALKRDGSVVAWGNLYSGSITNVPPGLSNVVAIAAGYSHGLGLRIDGTVVAWGDNGSGQTNVPVGLTNVVAVAAGAYSSLAVRRDGRVVEWPDTQPNLARNLSNVIAIARGETSLALHSDGTITETGSTLGTYWRRKLFSNVATICNGFALGPNQVPLAYPDGVFGGLQDRDIILMLRAFDPNGDTLHFRIVSLPQTGTLYQFENGARGPAILTPQTLVTHSEGFVLYAPAKDSNDLAPSFTFIANDGELDSEPILVPLTTWRPPVFPRINLYRSDGRCGFDPNSRLTFVGDTNAAYRVWASTNLLDWQVLGNASLWNDSVFGFIDYQTNLPARFYKVSTP